MASPVCSGEQTFTREHDEPGPNNFDGNPVICLGSDVRKLLLQIGEVSLSFRSCLRRLVKLATVRQQIAFNSIGRNNQALPFVPWLNAGLSLAAEPRPACLPKTLSELIGARTASP